MTKYTIDGSGDGTASNVINIRDAFVSNLGSVLLSIDYSQIEIRLLAHLSEDSKLCEILTSTFKEKADVFARIADTWLAKARPLTQDKQSGREQAKRVAYSIIYGTSSYGLGKQLGVDIDTAETLKTSFLSFFSTVHAHGESVKKFAAKEGYVVSRPRCCSLASCSALRRWPTLSLTLASPTNLLVPDCGFSRRRCSSGEGICLGSAVNTGMRGRPRRGRLLTRACKGAPLI